ncbi:hypothetical protein [Halapricum salinum]|uniref:Uncharacterized protein n=1 Tax=Halapricum salinum TaxID=1457250 RepID=A0A4D6HCS8_9EURY|nr:hypothetical protein [Halapricum salinum]QCC50527.1 hypothetical protein DV733_04405 [Halapricum salinum]
MDEDPSLSSELEETLEKHRTGSGTSGTLVLSDQEGYVGDTITLKGRNFPAEEAFEVLWHSTEGDWGVLKANEIVGPQYRPRTDHLMTVTSDADGRFDQEWTIPEDYGGAHKIEIQHDGETIDKAELEINPWFELETESAPLGGTFTFKGYGLGPNVVTNNYQVSWDNSTFGFMTGVMNRGTATAEIRAVGPPGKHVIEVWRNYRGIPYLQNNTQSPYGKVCGDRPSRWTVEVTEPEQELGGAWMDEQFEENPIELHYPDLDAQSDATLEITPTSGQAGTQAFITGEDFPPNKEVDLIWYRHEGHRVKGIPITPEQHRDVLPTVQTDADGRFQVEIEIPPEEGATRPITAEVDGREIAVTGFVVQPRIEKFTPREGPVGTTIEIELSGVGWTMYENGPFLVYDNKPLGYACGTSGDDKGGVIKMDIPAAGEPGYHFIDIYPTIYEMQEDEPNFEIFPHLSYLDNHPVRPLPASHFVFEVTEE